MKKYRNGKSFARFPNKMFAFDTKYWCNNDEKLVYLEMQFMQEIGDLQSGEMKVETLPAIIAQRLGWHTPSKPKLSRQRVVNALNSLKQKDYIMFFGEIKEEDMLTTPIKILGSDYETVVEVDIPWADKSRKFTGFTHLTSIEYNELKAGKYDLTLYTYTNWRENIGYKISYVEWAKVLGTTDRTARTVVENTGVITKIQGAFNKETKKNETNSYVAEISDNKDKNKTKQAKEKSAIVEEVEEIVEVEEIAIVEEIPAQEEVEVASNVVPFKPKSKKEETKEVESFYEESNYPQILDSLEEDPINLVKQMRGETTKEAEAVLSEHEKVEKERKIREAIMRKITDKDVKGDSDYLAEIQDMSVLLTQRAYDKIKTTHDGKLREYGNRKLIAIAESEKHESYEALMRFDKEYEAKNKKKALVGAH